jgi:hypothetical protein
MSRILYNSQPYAIIVIVLSEAVVYFHLWGAMHTTTNVKQLILTNDPYSSDPTSGRLDRRGLALEVVSGC